MSLRKFLPAKFLNRLVLICISLLLACTVLILWNSAKTHKPLWPQARLRGSSNLIFPSSVSIIEAKDDDAPDMYKDFERNPQAFAGKKNDVISWDEGKPDRQLEIPAGPIAVKPKKKERKGTPRVKCLINNATRYTCLRSKEGEIYMPFKFIEKYFEVYGEFINASVEPGKKKRKNKGTFFFHHSNSWIYPQVSNYTPRGEYLYFKQYNVEGRSKVMLISGEHGVPVSNQWDKAGYIYPIQVGQYGLSHYSKLIEDSGHIKARRTVLEDGTEGSSQWATPPNSKIIYKKNNRTGNSVVYFNSSPHENKCPSLTVNDKRVEFCLSFDVKFLSPVGNVSVVLESEKGYYVLTYNTEKLYKKSGYDSMIYGIGACRDWCTLHRDLTTDIKKFLPPDGGWRRIRDSLKSIHSIEVRGEGYIDNIELSEKCHKGHFKSASDWMVQNQDSNGGWPVGVKRVITTQMLTLDPGWYSAMAQGQAISLLVRAYITYKKTEYLTAAIRGLGIYQNLSTEHGVKAMFLDKYTWYEEYPTTPPLFVLNGFIYSLFGLYDLAQIAEGQAKVLAQRLYDDGMTSLKVMLNLFDTGTGTFYDLRHVTISGMAPNRARWNYHTVHIGQLYYLSTIDSDPIFNSTMKRWMGYYHGKWAPHN